MSKMLAYHPLIKYFKHANLKLLAILFVPIMFAAIVSPTFASGDWGRDMRFKQQMSLANEGDTQAMYEVGVMYERGHGVEKNYDIATQWYQKASELKHYAAMSRLGKMYLHGKGVNKNINRALKLFKTAAKYKDPSAYFNLASIYEQGATNVPIDLKKSIKYYDLAAKVGHYNAEKKRAELTKRLRIQQAKSVIQTKVNTHATAKNTKFNKQGKSKLKSRLKVSVTDIKKSLLTGLWHRGDAPIAYLPSTRTFCVTNSPTAVKCVSKELHRETGVETIYYLTESTLSNINSKGDFSINYRYKVTRVVVSVMDENGDPYVSQIKLGLQRKNHKLNCNIVGKKITCKQGKNKQLEFVNLMRKHTRIFIDGDVFE